MPASSCSVQPREERREQGLSLIEVLVALFLLGIILSAVAASLITFTRSASSSERRVQATAFLNELHEQFQALPFDLAGNLDTEVSDLTEVGAAVSHSPPAPPSFNFEGRDGVVVFEDCNEEVDGDCRRRVPQAYQVVTEPPYDPDNPDAERRELYEVYQIVTWVDRSGDGIGDTKRLTTIVEWQWLGRDYVERFESERAPTISEAGAPSAARAFLTMPSTVQLASPADGSASNTIETAIPAVANFTVAVDPFSVELVIRRLNATDDALVEERIALEPDISASVAGGGFTRFLGAITPIDVPGESRRFPVGILQFRVEGTPLEGDGPTLSGPADVRFVGQGATVESGIPLEIVSASASPPAVNVGNANAFRCPLTIEANVRGLSTDASGQVNGQVTASTTDADGDFQTRTLVPVGGVAVESGTTFSFTLGTSSNHGFTHSNWRDVIFEIVATRSGEPEQSDIGSTNTVRISSNNSAC